jgi:hypothetical protein
MVEVIELLLVVMILLSMLEILFSIAYIIPGI